MNFFRFHLGDWAAATAHLTMVEDAVYGRLIRRYYNTEAALPVDHAELCRVVGARSKVERQAVDTVLAEYFELCDDGYHQSRCDAEIAAYQATQAGADAAKAAEHERLRRHRQERSDLFAGLRAHGVSLPWNTPMGRVRELAKQYGVASASAPEASPATPPATDLQRARNGLATANPATSSQLPIKNKDTHTTGLTSTVAGACSDAALNEVEQPGQGSTPLEPEYVTRDLDDTQPETRPATRPATVAGAAAPMTSPTEAGRICRLMRQQGVADTNPGNPKLLALIGSGLSDAQFQWAAGVAVEKSKGFAYALAALKGASMEAQQVPAVAAVPAEKPPTQAELQNYRLMPGLFKGTPLGERIVKYLEEQQHAVIA